MTRHRIGRPELLLVALSLCVALACLEFAARRAFLLPLNPNADGWWQVGWLKRSSGVSSEYERQAIDKFHPVLGWTLQENLDNVKLLESRVSSNSRGVRGRREYSIENRSRKRLVVIGDSYTFGEGVNDDQTYCADLERLLDGVEVLNLAVHGYGTDQQLLRLQLDGLAYRPDVVVLGYYEDDVARNRLRFRDYQKPHFSVVNNQLVLDNTPIESPESYKSRPHIRSLGYLNIFMTALRERQLEVENVDRSRRILGAIVEAARSIGARFVQVYLPTPDQIHANESIHPGLYSHLCERDDVTCVDPTPALYRIVADNTDWRRLFRYHYAPEIHQAIAQDLARAMPQLLSR